MPSSRALHVLDVVLAVWVAAWIGLGVAIGINVHDLTRLSRTAIRDGEAVQTVGKSLDSLRGLPVIGTRAARDSAQIQQAGASAIAGGQTSAASIQALSVLLAIAVALLPSVPVFGLYLPARIDRIRERRAVARALSGHRSDPAFHAFLARRAIDGLGYHRLRRLSAHPWTAFAEGEDADLAAAELARLGIDPGLLQVAEPSRR